MLRLKHKLDKDHTLSCLDFQFRKVYPFIGYFTIVMFGVWLFDFLWDHVTS